MEKYTQFRDRASGIAPFLPIVGQIQPVSFLFHLFLFCLRLPLLLSACIMYFTILQWLPVRSLVMKVSLWITLGISGIWWIDLQIEGVRRGSLAQHSSRLPHPGTVIASSFTSPFDALCLAAIFNPIFTISYPSTRKVRQISLLQAIFHAFSVPQLDPPPSATLTDIVTLLKRHPNRCVAVFPECTTTNGKGILQLSPSLITTSPETKIFPISLRYTPADITTPVPRTYFSFLWNLLSKPTHYIRVRIAEPITVKRAIESAESAWPSSSNAQGRRIMDEDRILKSEDPLSTVQDALLEQVAEALARLGRVKRVGLGVHEKKQFVVMWTKGKRR
ncbi:hypothetical protein VTO42DRAFT_8501 [Malbranchea cinnamomea]